MHGSWCIPRSCRPVTAQINRTRFSAQQAEPKTPILKFDLLITHSRLPGAYAHRYVDMPVVCKSNSATRAFLRLLIIAPPFTDGLAKRTRTRFGQILRPTPVANSSSPILVVPSLFNAIVLFLTAFELISELVFISFGEHVSVILEFINSRR